jgi:hypothetical protein
MEHWAQQHKRGVLLNAPAATTFSTRDDLDYTFGDGGSP